MKTFNKGKTRKVGKDYGRLKGRYQLYNEKPAKKVK